MLYSSQNQSLEPLSVTCTFSSSSSSQPGFASSKPSPELAWILPSSLKMVCEQIQSASQEEHKGSNCNFLLAEKKLQRFITSWWCMWKYWHHSDGLDAETEGKILWRDVMGNALIKILIICRPTIKAFYWFRASAGVKSLKLYPWLAM